MSPSVQKATANKPAAGVPFYTPAQEPAAGTVSATDSGIAIPTLYTPLTIRSLTLNNRFVVSPMCMYSADDGHLSDFHLVHLGQFALRGAALTFVEATAVQPNGRISPEDSGLWADSQIAPLRRITDFIRSQGQHSAIQLAHAGRKASTFAPWLTAGPHGTTGKDLVEFEQGGWPENVKAPSAEAFAKGFATPVELTVQEIQQLVKDFAKSAERAVEAGFDVIEIHAAHGYLLTEFLSPLSNKRTDQYGGSFENRTRVVIETIKAVRAVIPDTMPLFLRVSGTEWMESVAETGQETWDLTSTLRLARLLPDLGVDVLDVSSGGNSFKQKIERSNRFYQVNLAREIRNTLHGEGITNLLIGTVGLISDAHTARALVQDDDNSDASAKNGSSEHVENDSVTKAADLVFAGRQFLSDPNWVLDAADELGLAVKWPNQYVRAHKPGAKKFTTVP